MKYKIKDNLEEVMRKYEAEITPDVSGRSLESYLVGSVFEENSIMTYDYEGHDAPRNSNMVGGIVEETNHPMPYYNIRVWIPRECLEPIDNE